MKNKGRIFLNFIVAAAFTVIVVVGFFSIFSVADINVEVTAGEKGKTSARAVKADLEKFRGKSLLFLDMKEVAAVLAAYPYLEVERLEKSYPNGIVATLRERREVFLFENGEDKYILDDRGVVLAKNPSEEENLIGLFISDVTGEPIFATRAEAGLVLEAEDGGLLSLVYSMSEIAAYTDNISAIEVKYGAVGGEVVMDEVVFHMRTGVEIWVYDALDAGAEKMRTAMEVFEQTSDYNKGMNYIVVNRTEGEIVATYTRDDPMSADKQ